MKKNKKILTIALIPVILFVAWFIVVGIFLFSASKQAKEVGELIDSSKSRSYYLNSSEGKITHAFRGDLGGFYNREVIEDADIESFTILSEDLAKDVNNVYYKFNSVDGADSKLFKALRLPNISTSISYLTDSRGVSNLLWEDGNNLYCLDSTNLHRLNGFNLNKLRWLNYQNLPGLITDGVDVYYRCRKIEEVNISGLKHIEYDRWTDGKSLYHSGHVAKGFDLNDYISLNNPRYYSDGVYLYHGYGQRISKVQSESIKEYLDEEQVQKLIDIGVFE